MRQVVFWALAAVAVALLLGHVAVAAEQRVAFSRKLGVEILAKTDSGGSWCGREVDLVVHTDKPGLFETKAFPTLIQKLGAVLRRQCGTATAFNIVGKARGSRDILYRGRAEASADWLPQERQEPLPAKQVAVNQVAPQPSEPSESSTEAAPPQPGGNAQRQETSQTASIAPQSGGQQKPLAEMSLREVYETVEDLGDFGPGGAYSLVGEWRGRSTCERWGREEVREYTLSVYYQGGESYKAYIVTKDKEGRPGSIGHGRGNYLHSHNQLDFEVQERLYAETSGRRSLLGRRQSDADVFIINDDCKESVLKKVSDHPATAEAVERSLRFSEKAREWAEARMIRGGPIGHLPPAAFRMPTCQKVVAWARQYSLDQRLAVVDDRDRVLLHFNDESSAQVFQRPAYYWTPEDFYNARQNFYRTCREHVTEKDRDLVGDVLSDNPSIRAIGQRRTIDTGIASLGPQIIGTGLPAEDLYRRFNALVHRDEEKLRKSLPSQFRINGALERDYALARDELARYRDLYAQLLVENIADEAEGIPEAKQTFAFAANLLRRIDAYEGGAAVTQAQEQARQRVRDVAAAAADSKVRQLQAEIAAGANTVEQVDRLHGKFSLLESQAGDYLAEATLVELRRDLAKLTQDLGDAFLSRAVAGLEKYETLAKQGDDLSPGDVSSALAAMANQEAELEGLGLQKQAGRYHKVADKVRAALRDKMLASMRNEFERRWQKVLAEEHPGRWPRFLAGLNELPDKVQAIFGDYPVRDKAAAAAEAIRDSMRSGMEQTLRERLEQELTGRHGGAPSEQLAVLMRAREEPLYRLEGFDRLNEMQMAYAGELLPRLVETLAEEMQTVRRKIEKGEEEKPSFAIWGGVRKEAQRIRSLADKDSRVAPLQEETERLLRFIAAQVCRTPYQLDEEEAQRLVIAGKGVVTLGTWVCAMKAIGAELAEFEEPGLLFGSDNYVLKFGSPAGYVTIQMKEIEVPPDRTAFAGVLISDGVAEKPLDRGRWQAISAGVLFAAEQETGAEFGGESVGLPRGSLREHAGDLVNMFR